MSAEKTRRRVYDMVVAEKLQVQGFHYPFPGLGNIEKDGSGYGWSRRRGIRRSDRSDALNTLLTKTGRGLIAAPMINAATILIARRRRTLAVWAVVCV